MSASNGVIKIGRKGLKKFAFGEEGEPFEVDVVVAFQEWIATDESFRIEEGLANEGMIPAENMGEYHRAAVAFAERLAGANSTASAKLVITTAEALDFIARLREQYDELAAFFRPKLRQERDSPDTSGVELRFSVEPRDGN